MATCQLTGDAARSFEEAREQRQYIIIVQYGNGISTARDIADSCTTKVNSISSGYPMMCPSVDQWGGRKVNSHEIRHNDQLKSEILLFLIDYSHYTKNYSISSTGPT